MAGKDDPVAKLAAMVEKQINDAFERRDRSSAEEKDPWKKIEGLIDRAVGKHFDEFRRGLEDPEEDEDKDKGEGGGDILGLGLFGGGGRR